MKRNWYSSILIAMGLFPLASAPLLAQSGSDSYVEWTVNTPKGEQVYILIETVDPATDDANVWFDLNGNHTKDPGEGIQEIGNDMKPVYALTVNSPTLRVYGNLKVFSNNEHEATSLDVTHMPTLVNLFSVGNKLTSVDLTKNPKLEIVQLSRNKLSTIDLSQNTALKEIALPEVGLKSIDLSALTSLTYADLSDNDLTVLDVSHNTNLENLFVGNNPSISSLDVTKNTHLQALDISSTKISTLDVSANLSLLGLSVNSSLISSLDLSRNQKLQQLYFHTTAIQTMDLSNNPALAKIVAYKTQLQELDLSKQKKLSTLYIYSSSIGEGAMGRLAQSLPTVDVSENKGARGLLLVINTRDPNEKNVCTKDQVAVMKSKNWDVYDFRNGDNYGANPYEGSERSVEKVAPADLSYINTPQETILTLPSTLVGHTLYLYDVNGSTKIERKIVGSTEVLPLSAQGLYILRVDNHLMKILRD